VFIGDTAYIAELRQPKSKMRRLLEARRHYGGALQNYTTFFILAV